MPGRSSSTDVETKKQEAGVKRQESKQAQHASRWDRHKSHKSDRTRYRSRSNSRESYLREEDYRARPLKYGTCHSRLRSQSHERSPINRKGRLEDKPSAPVVSQVCLCSTSIAVHYQPDKYLCEKIHVCDCMYVHGQLGIILYSGYFLWVTFL